MDYLVPVDLLVAVSTAMMLSLFAFPFRSYRCWLSWSRAGALGGIVMYLLVGGFGGVAGWLAVTLTEAKLGYGATVNGFLYGVAGSLAIRADLGSPRPGTDSQARQVASVLGWGIGWSIRMLDDITRRRAKFWLARLADNVLLAVAADIAGELGDMPASEVSAAARRATMARIVEAMRDLRSPAGEELRHDARMRLINFAASYFAGFHIAKPAPDHLPTPGPRR